MEVKHYDSILKAIYDHSLNNPHKLALIDKKIELTYKDLYLNILKAANYLKDQGILENDIVVIQGIQKVDFMIASLAIQLLGATICPIEKATQTNKILDIIKRVDAKYYIAEKENDISLKTIIYKDIMNYLYDDNAKIYENDFPKKDNLAEILFTTGTTGKSKGIEITHEIDTYIVENIIDSVKMIEDEIELLTSPINHSLAIRRAYTALYLGSTAIITDGFKFANTFFNLMDKYKVTAITLVPAIFEQIVLFDKDKFASYNSQLNYIQFGSAPLSEDNKLKALKMFNNIRLYNTYGATESACTITLEFSKYPDKYGSIGKITRHTTLLIVDDNRQIINSSKDNPGLLAFKGKMNMKGYYKDLEETKKAMDDNGIVYTNDVGYIDEDEFVYLIGRKGDVINMGGIKIAPSEIEEVANRHPMVKDCALIPIDDEITGQAPKLFIELNDGYEFDKIDLEKYLRENIEAIKVPKVYEVIAKIPRTFNGKIIRKDLKGK